MPTSEVPPMKRPRHESSTVDNDARFPTRSDIWFDDGSVVLQAELVQFRVHRTVLARHSSIFKDMFSIPQPPCGAMVEGCPLVLLHDNSEDVYHILTALYDKNYGPRQMIPFPVLAAMLRLGKKYEIDYLRDEALARLVSEFPRTLKEMQLLPPEYSYIKPQKGILYDIINLARETAVYSILPVAFYLCLQDIEKLFFGEERDDGSIARVLPAVQQACVLGRDKILLAMPEYTLAWLDEDDISDQCNNKVKCATARAELTRNIWKPMPDSTRSLEKWSDVPSEDLCTPCSETAMEIHERGRQAMWSLLPSFFGLPDWDHLKDFTH